MTVTTTLTKTFNLTLTVEEAECVLYALRLAKEDGKGWPNKASDLHDQLWRIVHGKQEDNTK